MTFGCLGTRNDNMIIIFVDIWLSRDSPRSSQHYSKHSSLLTDLSLTPSPPAHLPNPESRDVDTPDHDDNVDTPDHDNDEDHSGNDPDDSDGSRSTASSSDASSYIAPVSRTVEESLTTPQDIRCEEELPADLSADLNADLTDDLTDDLSSASPHFNTPELATDLSILSTCTETRHASSHTSSHTSAPGASSTPKPCSINNNLVGASTPSPYCSPSPVYSIPSPGSAFSVVISRRRESES